MSGEAMPGQPNRVPWRRSAVGGMASLGLTALWPRLVVFTLMAFVLIASVVLTNGATDASAAWFAGDETVDISTDNSAGALLLSNMVPGDAVTAALTVTNNGTTELLYAMRSTTTEATLASQLNMTIKVGVATCTNAGFHADGTVIYGPSVLGSTAGLSVIGDPAYGAQPGDRLLGARASEVLCIQVSLPLTTGNDYQALKTATTLDIIAEQTARK